MKIKSTMKILKVVLILCFLFPALMAQSSKAKCELCNLMSGDFYGVDSVVQRQKVRVEGCMLKSRNYDKKGKLVWGAQVGLKGIDTSYVMLDAIDAGKGNFQAVILYPTLRYTDFGKISEFWTDTALTHMFCIGTPLDCIKDSVKVKKANEELNNMVVFCNRKTSIEALRNRDSDSSGLKITFQDPSSNFTSMKDVTIVFDGDTVSIDDSKKKLYIGKIKKGEHSISVSSKWWKPQHRTITIEKGKMLEIIVKFKSKIGELDPPAVYH
ncbi:MAG: archaellum component FlaF (FlaF/FlaG flagellin family) [Glaciecola sp.]|jgi:archaellum component FlaF (FlaF/FlaG flagellin family)